MTDVVKTRWSAELGCSYDISLRHDGDMGKCVLHDRGRTTVTPNMPKLQYALQFTLKSQGLGAVVDFGPAPQLAEALQQHEDKWGTLWEKRDGVNLLFYQHRDRVVPKTRMRPVAGESVRRMTGDPAFPLREVHEMVRGGHVPVMEVWGPAVGAEYGLMSGRVDKAAAVQLEGLAPLQAEVIAVRRHEPPAYPYLPLREAITVAREHGLDFVRPFRPTPEVQVNANSLLEVVREADQRNADAGTTVTEGAVLHVRDPCTTAYGMWKLKSAEVTALDAGGHAVPAEVLEREVSRVLSEAGSFLDAAMNFDEYLADLRAYLMEDYTMTDRETRRALRALASATARGLAEEDGRFRGPGAREQAGRAGVSRRLIRWL